MQKPFDTMAMKSSPSSRPRKPGLMDALYGWRVSERFAPRPVDDMALHGLLYAALQAPGPDHEAPAFAIVRSRALLQKLGLAVLQGGPGLELASLGRDAATLTGASALVVIYEQRHLPEAVIGGWLAGSTLMLAAYAIGLGSCPMMSVLPVLDTLFWRQTLDIPPDLRPVVAVALGWPADESLKFGTKSPNVLSWTD